MGPADIQTPTQESAHLPDSKTAPEWPMSRAELEAEIAKVRWHHQIDLGGGIVTPGKDPSAALSWPSTRGPS